MKKLLAIIAAFVVVAGVCKPAQAECDGMYLALRGGMIKYNLDDKKAVESGENTGLDDEKLMISGALGYRYEWFRTELEYVWRDYSKGTERLFPDRPEFDETIHFKTYSYMWNFYWDILPYHWLSPYVNVGIGLTKIKYYSEDNSIGYVDNSFNTTRFTWSAGAGLSVKVTNRWNVDLGYRYYDMNHLKNADLTAQEFYAGVRYVF